MKQFARFVAVGIANTLFGYALIFGFMFIAGWSPEASNVSGYAIGLVTSYLMNRSFTFRSNNKRKSEFVRFLAVFAIAFGANFLALWILLHVLHVQDWKAQILAGIAYVVTSYLLNGVYVFGPRRSGEQCNSETHAGSNGVRSLSGVESQPPKARLANHSDGLSSGPRR